MKYYDWNKTLSYNAPITIVIGARGIGKTYGARLSAILDYINNKNQFVVVSRYDNRISKLVDGYFNKLSHDRKLKKYEFKTNGNKGYIRKIGSNEWNVLCYFVSYTKKQDAKEESNNFERVRTIIMDEMNLEKDDDYGRYLTDEWGKLASLVDSVTRERPESEIKPRVILLGNATDMSNPYFREIGLRKPPKYGYTWYLDKLVLLHYVRDDEYSSAKRKTVAGRMLKNRGDDVIDNVFAQPSEELLGKKTSDAQYMVTLRYMGENVSIWIDWDDGYYYVTNATPSKNATIYAMTINEEPNYLILDRTNGLLKQFANAYRLRMMKFDDAHMHDVFITILRYNGWRI